MNIHFEKTTKNEPHPIFYDSTSPPHRTCLHWQPEQLQQSHWLLVPNSLTVETSMIVQLNQDLIIKNKKWRTIKRQSLPEDGDNEAYISYHTYQSGSIMIFSYTSVKIDYTLGWQNNWIWFVDLSKNECVFSVRNQKPTYSISFFDCCLGPLCDCHQHQWLEQSQLWKVLWNCGTGKLSMSQLLINVKIMIPSESWPFPKCP